MGDGFEVITIDNKEYHLRYPTKTLISMQKEAWKVLGFKENRKINANQLLSAIGSGDIEYLVWVFWNGILWENDKMKLEEAQDIYDKYMDEGEPDSGGEEGKYLEFINILGSAMNLRFHINLKNAQARLKAEAEEKEKDEKEMNLKEGSA